MIEYWVQKLTEYGNYIDHDPTEYFLPHAGFMPTIELLIAKGYFSMEDVLYHEDQQSLIYGREFVLGLRNITSFMDMMAYIGYESDDGWDEYPSLLYAAEYLASDIATPEEKEFYGNPERWVEEEDD